MAVTARTRARIIQLFDAGENRNAIAHALKVAGSTVTRICADAGREFDRSQERLALRAESADLEALRKSVATKMLIVADDALDDIATPHLIYNFGGKDNTYNSRMLDEAPFDVKLDAMRAASLAVDKATRIIERTNTGLDGAVGILDKLAVGLQAAADEFRRQDEEATEEQPE